MAKRYFPNNELIINEYSRAIEMPTNAVRNPYYLLLRNCINEGMRIDTIGLQYHMFFNKELYKEKAETFYDLKYLYDLYGRLSDFGKPLQVTEVTIPCYSSDPEAEELQADIIETLYKFWFSLKNMESIIYWNLLDGYAAFASEGTNDGENYFKGGLVRYDFTKKPAYDRLYNLIHNEWNTSFKSKAPNGLVAFRGFYGKYKVGVIVNGRKSEHIIELKKNGINEFNIVL